MSLLDTMHQDMVTAMKTKDRVKLDALRYLISQIKYVQIDQGELGDAEVQKIIAKEIKQGEEAVAQFKQGGRQDLVEQESQKMIVWRSYLPQLLTDAELETVITQELAKLDRPDLGTAMRAVMTQVGTRASGQQVASKLKTILDMPS